MKQVIFIIFCVVIYSCCYSQNQQIRSIDSQGAGWMNDLIITDYNGVPFKTYYDNVQGYPYLFEDWKFANITLSKGKKFEKIKIRIDICKQEVHFITTNNREIVTPNGLITEVTFIDSAFANVNFFKLRAGFPPIDYQTENNFYQLLSGGRIQLLKSVRKKIIQQKNDVSGESVNIFDRYEDLYIFSNGQIKRLKKDKAFLLDQMNNQAEKMEEYIKANKVNLKNTDNLIRVFDYYNSL